VKGQGKMKSLERLISCMVTELSDHVLEGSLAEQTLSLRREAAVRAIALHREGEVGPEVLAQFLQHVDYKLL
jgi:hypothetical protein